MTYIYCNDSYHSPSQLTKSSQDKSTRLEEEVFKFNRLHEENLGLKKKLDKAKRMEYLGASDEILVEEVKMYKVRFKHILFGIFSFYFAPADKAKIDSLDKQIFMFKVTECSTCSTLSELRE